MPDKGRLLAPIEMSVDYVQAFILNPTTYMSHAGLGFDPTSTTKESDLGLCPSP